MNRAIEQHNLRSNPSPREEISEAEMKADHFFVKSSHKIKKVRYQDIRYVESMREYVRIHTTDKRYMVHQTMNAMEKRLTPMGFLRIHRSYMVNLEYLDSLQGNRVFVGEEEIPVGGSYKQKLLDRIDLL